MEDTCPICEDGVVWIRVEIDHELPAPCPECHGEGVLERPHLPRLHPSKLERKVF